MRGTTRDPARCAEIEAAGAEPVVGDPDVVATLARSLEHVGVACVLLGSAIGSPDQLAALHGSRLDMLLTRVVDTTVRGLVYEAAGSVDPEILDGGVALMRARCEDARIRTCCFARIPVTIARGWPRPRQPCRVRSMATPSGHGKLKKRNR